MLERIYIIIALYAFSTCSGINVTVPVNYTALFGDLEVHVSGLPIFERAYHIQLLEYISSDGSFRIMNSVPLNNFHNISKVQFPCGIITQGGKYAVKIPIDNRWESDQINDEENTIINVKWPNSTIILAPEELETYPENPVSALVSFQSGQCEPAIGSLVPETWFTLIYCGHSFLECNPFDTSHASKVLFSQQIRGYPSLRSIPLECNLFGEAGYYTAVLSSGSMGTGSLIAVVPTDRVMKVVWSEKFVFNVHARTIFQCDAHAGGIAVLFQYPKCVLKNDKIRLYGRLRYDVLSSFPPTTLHYITEKRIPFGKHSLYFDCDLFTEKYVEYCFVYVNEAYTGATSNVRTECIPTYPVTDANSGKWGPWSSWSPCSTTCKGGTRNRYRFCNSPHYGAKFCEGPALETQECGNVTSWECQLYINNISPKILMEVDNIKDEIGPACKCGCVIHLGEVKPTRLLATSTHSCKNKSVWIVESEDNHVIHLHLDHIHLPCADQKIIIRDGSSIFSNLLAHFNGIEITTNSNLSVITTGPRLSLEIWPGEFTNEECDAGFLCHIQQNYVEITNMTIQAQSIVSNLPMEAVHVAIVTILTIVVVLSLCMLVQYISKYHKYQRASLTDDFADTDCSDVCLSATTPILINRGTSTSSLLEFIPLNKLNKKEYYQPVQEEDTENKEDTENGIDTSPCSTKINVQKTIQLSTTVHKETKNDVTITPAKILPYERMVFGNRKLSEASSHSSNSVNVIKSPNLSISGSSLKRAKDRKNREKMKAYSDSSLTGHDTDLEMDYYDYNVQNTNAVPGSYLAMDPAYCLWIPPFAPGQWERPKNYEIIELKNMNGELTEKYENENKEKENNRFSKMSSASSDNRTVIAADFSDEECTMQEPIKSVILTENQPTKIKEKGLKVEDNIKFADEDDDIIND